mgnify:CR=1 FL=1
MNKFIVVEGNSIASKGTVVTQKPDAIGKSGDTVGYTLPTGGMVYLPESAVEPAKA